MGWQATLSFLRVRNHSTGAAVHSKPACAYYRWVAADEPKRRRQYTLISPSHCNGDPGDAHLTERRIPPSEKRNVVAPRLIQLRRRLLIFHALVLSRR